jgi:DNA-binding PadR family transcriptional regulator
MLLSSLLREIELTISLDIIPMRVILESVSEIRDRQPADLIPLSPQVFHILVALAGGDLHGYAIMQEVAARSGGKLRLSPGTLYGSIKRLLEQGAIAELSDRERPGGRGDDERRRYYRLTSFGRNVAKAEAARLAESLEQARVYGLAPKLP